MDNNPTNRVVTVVEGRNENKKIVDDFTEAAKKRGWSCQCIGYVNSDLLARYDLSSLPLDFVVFRSLTNNNYAEAERLLFYLKRNHRFVINADAAGSRCATSDKHFQQGLFLLDPFLKDYALPTFESKSKDNVMSYIEGKRVHFPILLKSRYGTTGKDILLIRNEAELEKVEDFDGYVIEQYVEPECDWRVFVIGGTAVGIMRKRGNPAHPEDFSAWSGGYERFVETDPDTIEILSKIACRAADVSRLEYTGVDIVREAGTKKLYLLETNFAAGWMNFTPITKIDIPELVIDWFEDLDDARKDPIHVSVKRYIEKRRQHLSRETNELYDKILDGDKGVIEKAKTMFKDMDRRYLYDSGMIFDKLISAYERLADGAELSDQDKMLIDEIESMPFSWAGNFIGPELGTLEEGAILSALYLYILGKTDKV